MKSKTKLWAIIAIMAAVGFSMTSCGELHSIGSIKVFNNSAYTISREGITLYSENGSQPKLVAKLPPTDYNAIKPGEEYTLHGLSTNYIYQVEVEKSKLGGIALEKGKTVTLVFDGSALTFE
ncbi:MAG: hypothetical protein LBG95_06800 [Treponema sp.]|jgi:hypothetical protein|nr:hypothetical protein [Treponema sp.]